MWLARCDLVIQNIWHIGALLCCTPTLYDCIHDESRLTNVYWTRINLFRRSKVFSFTTNIPYDNYFCKSRLYSWKAPVFFKTHFGQKCHKSHKGDLFLGWPSEEILSIPNSEFIVVCRPVHSRFYISTFNIR